ncbi:MAG: 2-oxoglutarate dehydrogenase E1 component [Rickettsiales bacterium]|nr:MAG: 2-oxoglutarate dehydrogenase E1 component [Rickettsiales bacterium]
MTKDLERTGFLFGSNSVFIEELYQKYLEDPASIDPSWIEFFSTQTEFTPLKTTSKIIIKDAPKTQNKATSTSAPASALKEDSLRAKFMIMAYREHGHYLANLDPLNLETKKTREELKLTLEDFGFTKDSLANEIDVTGELSGVSACTVGELVSILDRTYSGSLAAEFSHVESSGEKEWLYEQLENANTHPSFSLEDKKKFLQDLVEVEGFEQYLHTKFSGAKRFSIEGGDASIVCLDRVIELSAASGAEEAVLGLSHRGRLSTLTKVMGKPYCAVLSEFMGTSAFPTNLNISGDVKYHMGFSSDKVTRNGHKIHLSLTPNPSHLEAVNPVVAGKVRAKQDCMGRDRSKVVGILVHGDAAFCGQGIVAESLVMSGLVPYEVGGIFHLVINNQIGFTANANDSRPGRYCTEVAKMVGAPILHVNGDDIESVLLATKIACDYRTKFGRDVVVDIVCYRKYGHNEGDEPMYTQGQMYNIIKTKQTPAAIYAEKLVSQALVDAEYYPGLKQTFKTLLDSEFAQVEEYKPRAQWLEGHWSGFERSNDAKLTTGIKQAELKKLCKSLCTIEDSFPLNKKLAKLFASRVESVTNKNTLDWASAEQLAFGTLLKNNIPIRMTGQDVGRGTFSHRHAVLHSQIDKSIYEPLNNISDDQAFFEIADSNLSEYGVLGFEYGYSLVNPKHLVIWEGQFGDFCNGAQTIFDQFISSAETKWLRLSGLVCLLPHGFEGQGPEHSSARLERFLQLCAEENMQVAYPTTPASIFHLLRRQVMRNFRKPLMIMSPKSLLRHKLAVSDIKDLDEGTSFEPVIDEIDADVSAKKVKKVIFCSGKVYYDLLEKRRASNINDIAIVRLEQLYPFEQDLIVKIIKKYSNASTYVWCQEEPKNMGAWSYIRPYMEASLEQTGTKKMIRYVGREEAASPAVGYLYLHNKQQESLVNKALGI